MDERIMDAFNSITRTLGAAFVAVAVVANSGCSVSKWKPSKIFSLDSTWPFHDKDEPREGVPSRMVCTWTDTVMTKAGEKPQRGFGGRIMFYEKDEKDPVIADGQLIVYAFDETDREPTDNKPTRRYVFPAEQMSIHMSKSELGASYSYWLPWDEAGGPKTDVSLICRFEPKGGAVITSEQTKHQLPGVARVAGEKGPKKPPKLPAGVPSKPQIPTLESVQAKRAEDHRAQLASYEVPVNGQPGASVAGQDPNALGMRQMTSTTISLPSDYQIPAMHPASTAPVVQTTTPAANGVMYDRQQTISAQQFPIQPPSTVPTTPVINMQMPEAQTSGMSAFAIPQTPMMQAVTQAQAQQTALQQQMLMQQQLQQQAFQQRMMPNQLPVQAAPVQMPIQSANNAPVSRPAVVQYR
jgi:hypothetical protein